MIGNRYTEIDHSADLGIEIHAGSIPELFSCAAEGYYNLALEKTASEGRIKRIKIDLEASDAGELLIAFLNELNFLLMTRHSVPESLESLTVQKKENSFYLSLVSKSIQVNPEHIKNEIKAVTYHQLNIDYKNNRYFTKIFFDI